MSTHAFPPSDPRYHTANIEAALDDLIQHLREDVHAFDEPKAQALFETSAEYSVASAPRSSTTTMAPKRRCGNRGNRRVPGPAACRRGTGTLPG